jgi:molybdopterin adenylyltransferase
LNSPKITFAVLTVSDSVFEGKSEDLSGPRLVKSLEELGYKKNDHAVVSDEIHMIEGRLNDWCEKKIDLIITTGGTGFSQRDVTPEATLNVIKRLVPGISEALRSKGLKKNPKAMLSRSVSGFCGKTLIINMPGSLNAVKEGMEVLSPVLDHAFDMRDGAKH